MITKSNPITDYLKNQAEQKTIDRNGITRTKEKDNVIPTVKRKKEERQLNSLLGNINVDCVESNHLNANLSMLLQYEQKHFELIRDFKEEIEFVHLVQANLRKEQIEFFSTALKKVSETLKATQVDEVIASKWLSELVDSYSKSIALSKILIEEHAIDMVTNIKKEMEKQEKNLSKSVILNDEK